MFRDPRRKDRTISEEDGRKLLADCTYGIVSTIGEDGFPYGVPISYVYVEEDNAIYFHCAPVGHKIENIRYSDKVSFCAVGHTKTQPELFSTLYESVIVFGHITELQGADKMNAFMHFIAKYAPQGMDQVEMKVNKAGDSVKAFKIAIEHITAKAKRLPPS